MKIFSKQWFTRIVNKATTGNAETSASPKLETIFKTSVDSAVKAGRQTFEEGLSETSTGENLISSGIDYGWRKFLPWILVAGVVALTVYAFRGKN
jgi:hypothetical protein